MVVLVSQGNEDLAKERLAQLIKELRGQKTQREFAKLLGTSYTAVQDWEKQIRLPKERNLKLIAQLKGWTHEELLCHLFLPNPRPETTLTNSLKILIAQIQGLSPLEMQELRDYLNTQLDQVKNAKESSMNAYLNDKQKHNLHLLLRASLKYQSPTEAMVRTGIDPELFTDIFLRNDQSRVVDYKSLEQLSSLCCRVVAWRADQLPEVDCNQTYVGEPELLFKTLANAEIDKAISDWH
ncbi:MAG: helix-turn-helix transcriptional regulator [Leptolyngbyaceae cyanobacterium SL_7_1]|nr:helix-turn-helix transcriptional regulator [Leptolyngbyaceae cyanobacterium SL_7_1]